MGSPFLPALGSQYRRQESQQCSLQREQGAHAGEHLALGRLALPRTYAARLSLSNALVGVAVKTFHLTLLGLTPGVGLITVQPRFDS